MSPDEVQPWLILGMSVVTGGTSAVTLVYSRYHRMRLDREALAALQGMNTRAIMEGRPVPYPEYLPESGSHPRVPDS